MNPLFKNILAVIIGLLLGSIVNMSVIMLSGSVIPPPQGVDPTDMESIKANMHLYQPIHFLFPFLAHALGTLVGALAAVKIGASHKMRLAMIIGVFFLIGGVSSVMMLPSPLWFSIVDIVFAYIPMGYLGYRLISEKEIEE